MDNPALPGNSLNKKTEPKDKGITRITTSDAITRRPPLSGRLRDLFVAGDATSVGGYIFLEVLVPALKDLIFDVVTQGAGRTLFGDSRSVHLRTGQKPSGVQGSPCNKYGSAPWDRNKQADPRPQLSRQARANHDFREIIIATRAEAEDIRDKMFQLINDYEQVTVLDLYEMVGISGNFTEEKWGWTDIRGMGIVRVARGYLLDLPRPVQLD